jgi:hypothetical protein
VVIQRGGTGTRWQVVTQGFHLRRNICWREVDSPSLEVIYIDRRSAEGIWV